MNPTASDAAILALERPHKNLFTYYVLSLLVFPPLLPILILPAWFRYRTMRYKFTDEGISMSWGILFRRETIVNYARIQDIHLRSNVVERWLGLAKVMVQTASGNAGAEMTLEGLREYEAVRDFLYARMRGVKDHARPAPAAQLPPAAALSGEFAPTGATIPTADAELAAALRAVAHELRETRLALAARASVAPPPPPHGPASSVAPTFSAPLSPSTPSLTAPPLAPPPPPAAPSEPPVLPSARHV